MGSDPLAVVERFNEAFNRHDLDTVMQLMTEDCVFEDTVPPPDGARHEGAAAVRAAFDDFFRSSPEAHFEAEEQFGFDEHAVVRWVFTWNGGHVRGVDVIRVKDGKVAEKLAYVKG
jgi:ketosteroid isomerase-like protein